MVVCYKKKLINEDHNSWLNGHAEKKDQLKEHQMFCLFILGVTQGNENTV